MKTDSKGQIIAQPKQQANVVDLIKRMEPQLARALPKHIKPDRMSRIVLTALRANPGLAECNAPSLMGRIMEAAQLGLEPNTPLGLYYLIPRRNNRLGTTECTAILGYQGMVELARRSKQLRSISARVVREGDEFRYTYGLHPTLTHVPQDDTDAKVTHAYAVAHLADAEPIFEVLSAKQIHARRDRSAARKAGPWVTDYEAMCCKTAVRAIWKWLPKSAEMALAEEVEQRNDLDLATPEATFDLPELPTPEEDGRTAEVDDAKEHE